MGFETFLNHICDIYHIQKTEKSPGYGLPSSPGFYYSAKPDHCAVRCHFSSGTASVTQKEPQANYEARVKLTLPAGTDIRVNDKIIDCGSGFEYTAEVPRDIRGHHIVVFVKRTARQEPI